MWKFIYYRGKVFTLLLYAGAFLLSSPEHCPPAEEKSAYRTGNFPSVSDREQQALQDERFARRLQEEFDAEVANHSDSVTQLEADRKLAEQLEVDGRLALQLSAESSAGVSNLSGLDFAMVSDLLKAEEAEMTTEGEEITLLGSGAKNLIGSGVDLTEEKKPAAAAGSTTGTQATRQNTSPPMPSPLPSITNREGLLGPSSAQTTDPPPDMEAELKTAQGITGAASDGGEAFGKPDDPSQRIVAPLVRGSAGGDASQTGDGALLADKSHKPYINNEEYELCVICLAHPSTAGFVHGSR